MNGYRKNYHLERKFHEFRDLRELLAESAKKYADKTAFVTKVKIEGGEHEYIETSYRQLYESTMDLGTALRDLGLDGARIAVVGENSYNWCLAYFAVSCGLGVIVPLDKLLQKDELASLLCRSRARAVFCDGRHFEMIREIMLEGRTSLEQVIGLDFIPDKGCNIGELTDRGRELRQAGERSYVDAGIDPDAMSFLLFTSGTTANSKAAMLSHRNLMSVNYGMNLEELFFPDDVNMMILPLHHCYGMSGLLTFLSQGIKNVFCDGLRYITINLKEYGVTVLMTVPLLLEKMYKKIWDTIRRQGMEARVRAALRACAAAERLGLNIRRRVFGAIIDQLGGRLRFITNGAAALDPAVARGFNDFGILTVQGYGLTETAPTIAAESYRYIKAGSTGKVLTTLQAKIDEPDADGIGELLVKGDSVFLGYYEDEAATGAAFTEDGWFRTGDLACFDEDEYLWITGRRKNVIVLKNGKNVFPEEIENLINELPYVCESMVFAQNSKKELILWAKVVYDTELIEDGSETEESLNARFEKDLDGIDAELPPYKRINRFFLSSRPTIKTTTQKTRRNDELHQIRAEMEERGLL